ncbi:ABC transporter permease [Microbacterium sp.]|uniref:ABC transporter permease n=1 Tax=Microbacterium sp. TaxID=51671 RepID=UPI0037C7173B
MTSDIRIPTPRSRFSPLALLERYGVIVAWIVVILVFSILRPTTFPTAGTVSLILGTQTVILVATLGLMLTLAVGEIDLSVGSVVGFGASLVVVLNGVVGINVWLAVLLTILACALFGLVNAVLTVIVGVQSIIVTLASGTLLAGITLAVTGSKVVTGLDSVLIQLVSTRWLGIPIPFYFGVVLTAILWFVMQHTPVGRRMAFVNANRVVARLAGIRVDRIRMGGLVATSVFAGIAGIILASQNGAANPQAGAYYLLPAFAGAFLGSTTIRPGSFNAVGTWVAVYFLITGITGLVYMGFAGWPEQVFYGASLLVAVSLGILARRRRREGVT